MLHADPFSGNLFLFRSKRADYLKILYYDGTEGYPAEPSRVTRWQS